MYNCHKNKEDCYVSQSCPPYRSVTNWSVTRPRWRTWSTMWWSELETIDPMGLAVERNQSTNYEKHLHNSKSYMTTRGCYDGGCLLWLSKRIGKNRSWCNVNHGAQMNALLGGNPIDNGIVETTGSMKMVRLASPWIARGGRTKVTGLFQFLLRCTLVFIDICLRWQLPVTVIISIARISTVWRLGTPSQTPTPGRLMQSNL